MNQDFLTAATNFHDHCAGLPTKYFSLKTFEVENEEELKKYGETLLRVKNNLQSQGITVVMKGVGESAVWLSHNGLTLRVQVEKKPKHTNVTVTSRNAYHSTDFSTQEKRIAAFIFLHTKDGGDVTRAEIANRLSVQEGRVSGRVNQLLKDYGQGGYTDETGNYRLILTGKRLSKCPGASDKLNESMRFEKFEPAADAAQTELF